MRKSMIAVLVACAVLCGRAQAQEAENGQALKLPSIFDNNMVLQQGMPLPVWGWAAPGEEITVRIAGQAKTATADGKGKWIVTLDPLAPGEQPVEMEVVGKSKITFSNVLVGEVWVCSGQSNMDFRLDSTLNAETEKAAADHSDIRFFVVPNVATVEPQENVEGHWAVCTPGSARWFSAVGYFFGRRLHAELKVPVGLIHTAWGGTPAESWTSREGLEARPELAVFLERFKTAIDNYPEEKKKYDEIVKVYQEEQKKAAADSEEKGWEAGTLDESGWQAMPLPQHWEKANIQLDGVVWFRKTVQLPADLKGKALTLSLGPIDDDDVTYVNGEKVGETRGYNIPRSYSIEPRLTEAGSLVIAVRVTDSGGPGGIYGDVSAMQLVPPTGEAVGIAGEWKYKIAMGKRSPPQPPMGPGNPWLPMSLYNAKIAPLIPFGIRGAIWYQGESNASRAFQYRTLFPAMIEDWRNHWKQGDFPFLFVQLANFQAPPEKPGESVWAELREAQTMTLSLPNTGMAVIIDIGDANDIHPKNKQDVGWRLAQWVLGTTYGKDMAVSGPLYKGMKVVDGTVVCEFDHVGGGLAAKAGALKQFAIAGQDKVFVWADAKIVGDTVVVSSADVAEPVAVRYAWANNPDGCNLYNREGLPASPFRTDDWPGTTDSNQ